MLDTGVDGNHPAISTGLNNGQVAGWFPESDDLFDPLKDRHGHGTHGISVLMRTAPKAAIYVARVTNDKHKFDFDVIVRVLMINLFFLMIGDRVGNYEKSSYYFDILG